MEAIGAQYIVHGSRSDEFTIWNLSDTHLLSASCAIGELRRDIKCIQEDDHAFWLGGGDYAEYIGPTDIMRFDPDCVTKDLTIADLGQLGEESVRRVAEEFEPIKHKCLGLALGNHELKYQVRQAQSNLHASLCERLGVPNLEYSALLDVVFSRAPRTKKPRLLRARPKMTNGNSKFRVFVHHGAGAAQTKGGKLNRLKKFMDDFDADIYFVGHVHDKTGTKVVAVGADTRCQTLTQRERIGVISGSYYKTYSQGVTSYGEQKGYSPTTLRAAWVAIKPETRELRGEI